MFLDSEKISERAGQYRLRLSEQEALISEAMSEGKSFDKMSEEFGVTREEFEIACNNSMVNLYFWILVALFSTRDAELYKEDRDKLNQPLESHHRNISLLSGTDTFH